MLDRPVLVAAILFVGSALMAFSQNLPVALLQQHVPEQVRGGLSGSMAAARNLLMAGSTVPMTALTHLHSAVALAAATAALLVTGFVAAGGFRGLTAND